MTWYEAEEWCLTNGMTMPTIYEMCPSWDGSFAGACPKLGNGDKYVWSATTNNNLDHYAYYVDMAGGWVDGQGNYEKTTSLFASCF